MTAKSKNLLIVLMTIIFLGCAAAPPEPKPPEPLTDLLSSMKENYWSCTNFFTIEDVSLVFDTQPTQCQKIETRRKTIGVIIDRDQPEPVITCVLPNSPAANSGLQRGAVIWAIASEGVDTPDAALKALQKYMKEGKKLVISTNRGSVSVVPQRAAGQKCAWEVPGDVSTRVVEYAQHNEVANTALVSRPKKPGVS